MICAQNSPNFNKYAHMYPIIFTKLYINFEKSDQSYLQTASNVWANFREYCPINKILINLGPML
jgi:uncharacterized membrane protein YecN with MAPEG domain